MRSHYRTCTNQYSFIDFPINIQIFVLKILQLLGVSKGMRLGITFANVDEFSIVLLKFISVTTKFTIHK